MTSNQNTNVERKVTRRSMIQFAMVGILAASAGLQVALRCLRPQNKLGITEITIEGPFEKYGYVRPKDFGQEHVEKLSANFKLLKILFSKRKDCDKVIITFTFTGAEKPDRKKKVTLSVYDKEGNTIGRGEWFFCDPRIEAREANAMGGMYVREPVSALDARLDHARGRNISKISRIEIFAIDVEQ